jgi:hypothetical protein
MRAGDQVRSIKSAEFPIRRIEQSFGRLLPNPSSLATCSKDWEGVYRLVVIKLPEDQLIV